MSKLNISKFDPSTIKANSVIILIGKRDSGKTTLMRDILYHLRDRLEFGIAFSPTDKAQDAFSSIMPNGLVYFEFNQHTLDKFLEIQEAYVTKDRYRQTFFVMDDCMCDSKTIMNTKTMRTLYMNGRHAKIMVLCAVQYSMDIPSFLRGQIDYIFLTGTNNNEDKRKIYKYFVGMFNKYTKFEAAFNKCTSAYDCMVIDNKQRSNEPNDCVFWYRPQYPLPEFRMCSNIFWRLNNKLKKTSDDSTDVKEI